MYCPEAGTTKRLVASERGASAPVVGLPSPTGVRGRNSDNTMIRDRLGWAPGIRLADGMERTYRWISDQVARGGRAPS